MISSIWQNISLAPFKSKFVSYRLRHVEDLTQVEISHEIYETSLRRVSISYEMTTSVRFCLSSVCLKWDCIAFKVDIISVENITLSRTASWRYAPVTKCYVTCGHTIFMPRHQKVAGYYVIPSEILSVRPSVRPSVCPSVRPSVRQRPPPFLYRQLLLQFKANPFETLQLF